MIQNYSQGDIGNRRAPKKILKFIIDKLPEGVQLNSFNPSLEIQKLAWYQGTHIDQIIGEIRKLACMSADSSFALTHNMVVFDQENCAIILSEEMDFSQVYKIKFIPTNLMETQFRGQPASHNESLQYTLTSINGTSLLRSPYIGETYHLFKGYKNNWQQQTARSSISRQIIENPAQNLHYEEKKGQESAKSIMQDRKFAKNNLQIMPSFGLPKCEDNKLGERVHGNGTTEVINLQSAQIGQNVRDLRGRYPVASTRHETLDHQCDITESFVRYPGSIISNTMSSHNLRPFEFRNGRKSLAPGRVMHVQSSQAWPQHQRQPLTLGQHFSANQFPCPPPPCYPMSARLPSAGNLHMDPVSSHPAMKHTIGQLNTHRVPNPSPPPQLATPSEQPPRFQQLYATIYEQKKEMLKKESDQQVDRIQRTQSKDSRVDTGRIGSIRINNEQSLSGLSEIKRIAEKFQSKSPQTPRSDEMRSETSYDEELSAFETPCAEPKPEKVQSAKQQQAQSDNQSSTKRNLASMAQEIDKLKQKFNKKHEEISSKQRVEPNGDTKAPSEAQAKPGGPVQIGNNQVNSLKIQDCLLFHVVKCGFKEGFHDHDKKDAKQEEDAKEAAEIKEREKEIAEAKKADSEKMITKTKEQAKNSGEGNNQGNGQKPFSKLDIKNQDVILFPAYPQGKFYKNNEDLILKNKIKKLEKQQDPLKLIQQQKLEQEQAMKLLNLSPFSSRATRQIRRADVDTILKDKWQGQSRALTPEIKKERSLELEAPQVDVEIQHNKTIIDQGKPIAAAKTPQPTQKNIKQIDRSPLAQIMKEIGLQIGENTGLNLNKLIQKKPEAPLADEAKKEETKPLIKPITPIPSEPVEQQSAPAAQPAIARAAKSTEKKEKKQLSPLTPLDMRVSNQKSQTPILKMRHNIDKERVSEFNQRLTFISPTPERQGRFKSASSPFPSGEPMIEDAGARKEADKQSQPKEVEKKSAEKRSKSPIKEPRKAKLGFDLAVTAQIAGTTFNAVSQSQRRESAPEIKKPAFYNGSFQMTKSALLSAPSNRESSAVAHSSGGPIEKPLDLRAADGKKKPKIPTQTDTEAKILAMKKSSLFSFHKDNGMNKLQIKKVDV